ncbi:MAG: hypothetical protein DMF80_17665 [Acidobacteria bacterium]|nr:MAG: hypothetical protein DMF80_17665 [Acidobacteriota bacterium]
MRASEELRAAVRARSVASGAPEAAAAARAVEALGGDTVVAVLFFGSRHTGAGPDPSSAWDLFVVTRGYAGFHRALRRAGATHRPAWLMAALNTLLTPSQVSLSVARPHGTLRAKCAVVSLADLRRETSPRRRDHFIAGRLFQPVTILLAGEPERDAVLEALGDACRLTWSWVRPWLPPPRSGPSRSSAGWRRCGRRSGSGCCRCTPSCCGTWRGRESCGKRRRERSSSRVRSAEVRGAGWPPTSPGRG